MYYRHQKSGYMNESIVEMLFNADNLDSKNDLHAIQQMFQTQIT